MSSPHHVLIVEDDCEIREILVDVLEEYGYVPIEAAHGRDALSKLGTAKFRPRLILLDLMMPIMDGKTFRQEQLKNPDFSDIPVVVLSAFRDVTESAKELKAVGHLQKPVNLSELMQLLHVYCQEPS